jgi:hypothetical protein
MFFVETGRNHRKISTREIRFDGVLCSVKTFFGNYINLLSFHYLLVRWLMDYACQRYLSARQTASARISSLGTS